MVVRNPVNYRNRETDGFTGVEPVARKSWSNGGFQTRALGIDSRIHCNMQVEAWSRWSKILARKVKYKGNITTTTDILTTSTANQIERRVSNPPSYGVHTVTYEPRHRDKNFDAYLSPPANSPRDPGDITSVTLSKANSSLLYPDSPVSFAQLPV